MSVAATTAVWFGSRAKGARKLVLLALADCANDEGNAWPSLTTMALKCGLESERGVRVHLRALLESGELSVLRERPGRTTVYRVEMDFLKNRAESMKSPRKDSAGVKKTAPRKDSVTTPGRKQPPTPEESYPPPRKDSAYDPKRNPKGTGEGTCAPTPPTSSADALGVPCEILDHLCRCFSDAPPALSPAERADFRLILPHLQDHAPDDWSAILAWNEATDRVRGRKLWPRDRGEFLRQYFEAIQKIRPWWRSTGKSWWDSRAQSVPISSKIEPDDCETLTTEEALALCREP